MKRLIINLTAVLIICGSTFAQPQPPDTLWTRTYGGGDADKGFCVKQTEDGGYITVGWTQSYGTGNRNIYLIKSNANGNGVWSRTYGNVTSEGYSVQQTSDGGYIVTGYTPGGGSGYDICLVKADSAGNEMWFQTYMGNGGEGVLQIADGGYIIIGSSGYELVDHDVCLINVDVNGNEVWRRTYGGNNRDEGYSIQPTQDGGYIIAGSTESYGAGYSDVYLIKTDNNGFEEWQQTFGGSYGDEGKIVQQTIDGGYIIAGWTSIPGLERDVYLIKTDVNGDSVWTEKYGGASWDYGESVQQTYDEGYIIAGRTESFGAGNEDVYLIRTDANGNLLWTYIFGGNGVDAGQCIDLTSDGGSIIAGYTQCWGAGNYDVYLIRLDSEGTLVEDFGEKQPAVFTLYSPCPNPFNSSTVISFELRAASFVELMVYDVMGREVQLAVSSWQLAGKHEVVWEAEGLGSGVYFVRLSVVGGQSMVKKVVMVK